MPESAIVPETPPVVTRPYRVLVLDRVDPAGLEILGAVAEVDARDAIAPGELLEIIGSYDALMVRSATKVTAELLEAGKRLQIVGRAGVGVDNIDVTAATQQGVVVVNSPEGNTIAAAEHAVALMLSLSRRVGAADAAMKSGQWSRERFVGIEMYQKTLGVLGLGKIGARVAKVARALGMRVLGCDPFLTPDRAQELGVEPVSFDDLLASSDVISLHVPKTPETHHLFNGPNLARCKPGVRLVNCSRGGIIDEAALVEAIRSGQVAGAALDVFEKEPLGESALRELGDRIVLTPHLGASTEEAQIKVAVDVAEQIVSVLEGGSARSAVNIPSLRAEWVESVRPLLPLAEKLGSLAAQLQAGAIQRIEVLFQGALASKPVDPLLTAVIKGVLGHAVGEGVNYVNAAHVARQRGIEIRESRSSEVRDYAELLTVTVHGAEGWHTVAGTILAEGDARIVRIDEHAFSLRPSGDILVATHQDRPGMIGIVGTLLGELEVNIFGFQLGRRYRNGPALMVLNVEDPITPDGLMRLGAIDGIDGVRFVRF